MCAAGLNWRCTLVASRTTRLGFGGLSIVAEVPSPSSWSIWHLSLSAMHGQCSRRSGLLHNTKHAYDERLLVSILFSAFAEPPSLCTHVGDTTALGTRPRHPVPCWPPGSNPHARAIPPYLLAYTTAALLDPAAGHLPSPTACSCHAHAEYGAAAQRQRLYTLLCTTPWPVSRGFQLLYSTSGRWAKQADACLEQSDGISPVVDDPISTVPCRIAQTNVLPQIPYRFLGPRNILISNPRLSLCQVFVLLGLSSTC